MPIVTFEGKTPVVAESAFIAPNAYVIGDVTIGENVSLFLESCCVEISYPLPLEREQIFRNTLSFTPVMG